MKDPYVAFLRYCCSLHLILVFASVFYFDCAVAADASAKSIDTNVDSSDADPQKLSAGVLASAGTVISRGVGFSENLDDGLGNHKASPIVGSVAWSSTNRCFVSLVNMSKKSKYSVNYAVEVSSSGGRLTTNSFSSKLAPSESAKHEFSCRKDDGLRLLLRSGNKLK